jgi:hypothetical protein
MEMRTWMHETELRSGSVSANCQQDGSFTPVLEVGIGVNVSPIAWATIVWRESHATKQALKHPAVSLGAEIEIRPDEMMV